MVKVSIKQNYIEINGHAMYDDYGKDIVCASISSIVITSVNLCLKFHSDSLKYKVKDGNMVIDILDDSKETKTIISNMIELLKELKRKYKKNIEIYEEV